MNCLPQEILENIFDLLPRPSKLNAVQVCSAWRTVGEAQLYADLSLRFDIPDPSRSDRCLNTLLVDADTRLLNPATFVRHLTIAGVTDHVIPKLVDALNRTSGLLSLDFEASPTAPVLQIHEASLPNLCAVTTNSNALVLQLAAGRRLCALHIRSFMDHQGFDFLRTSLVTTTVRIRLLQLKLTIGQMDQAIGVLKSLVESFPYLAVLGLVFRLPRPRDVTWVTFESMVREMGPWLSRLNNLDTLGLAFTPDPPVPVPAQARTQSQENIDARTKVIARGLVDTLTRPVRRVEVRWNGWMIMEDVWVPIPRCDLLRQDSVFHYTDLRRACAT
ncbi:hypothetical protein B0H21DRAFT_101025 [Amylocystis lapponica]|nr:hypothetical protein B0H21DRAFT_101025 [Amylocystis lapponica]